MAKIENAFLVRVDLSKLPRRMFWERKEGTLHIGTRYIPFQNFDLFYPCLWKNDWRTIQRVSFFFIHLNASNHRKELQSDYTGTPIWRIIG